MPISAIYEPIQEGMAEVEESFRAVGEVDLPRMAEPLKYVLESGGKRIRPAMTLLAGKFYRREGDEFVFTA